MKRIFNKFNGVLLAGLLAGVLLIGLGSGIAFAEYSGLDYDTSLLSSQSSRQTEEYSYAMAEGERVIAYTVSDLMLDESVPEGTLLLKTEFNPECVEVGYATTEFGMEFQDGSFVDNFATELDVYPIYKTGSFERFMQVKDTILEGLKEGRLVVYDDADCYSYATVAYANPADKERVFTSHESLYEACKSFWHGSLYDEGLSDGVDDEDDVYDEEEIADDEYSDGEGSGLGYGYGHAWRSTTSSVECLEYCKPSHLCPQNLLANNA